MVDGDGIVWIDCDGSSGTDANEAYRKPVNDCLFPGPTSGIHRQPNIVCQSSDGKCPLRWLHVVASDGDSSKPTCLFLTEGDEATDAHSMQVGEPDRMNVLLRKARTSSWNDLNIGGRTVNIANLSADVSADALTVNASLWPSRELDTVDVQAWHAFSRLEIARVALSASNGSAMIMEIERHYDTNFPVYRTDEGATCSNVSSSCTNEAGEGRVIWSYLPSCSTQSSVSGAPALRNLQVTPATLCTSATETGCCGDGIIDAANGEECDDGKRKRAMHYAMAMICMPMEFDLVIVSRCVLQVTM